MGSGFMGHLFSMMHPSTGTAPRLGEFPAPDLGDSTVAFSGGAQELSGTPPAPQMVACSSGLGGHSAPVLRSEFLTFPVCEHSL